MADHRSKPASRKSARAAPVGTKPASGKRGAGASQPQQRICRFSPTGGHLIVRLTANNALHAAGELGIWDPPGKELWEKWKMIAGVGGSSEYTVGTPPGQLVDAFLTWALLVCSHDANIDQGLVAIEVIQDGKPCVTDPPARYALTDVPACSANQVKPIRDKLRFKAI